MAFIVCLVHLQIYRLSSLDYSRVLSHLKRGAIAEAWELQQQAEAAAKAAAQAAAAGAGRFGGNSWESRATMSDGETPSSSSGSSISTLRGRWSQRGWAERAAATAAAGRPLAFLGERSLDGRREFEAQRRMISSYSSSSQSLPDVHSENLSFSDSLISPSLSEVGVQAAAGAAAARLGESQLDGSPGGADGSDDASDEETFMEDSVGCRLRSFGSTEGFASDMDYEPVEAHGFASSCKGLKASVSIFRLAQTIKKRKSLVASEALNLSIEAAEAAVMAQSSDASATTSVTTDCTVLSIFNIKVNIARPARSRTPPVPADPVRPP